MIIVPVHYEFVWKKKKHNYENHQGFNLVLIG